MRLLLDESLSHYTTSPLAAAGHDVVHVGDLDLLGAPDEVVLQAALDDGRVLVTADTDFGRLLAATAADRPSVLLLRGPGRTATRRAATITAAIDQTADELAARALVVVEADRIRIRDLPIQDPTDTDHPSTR